MVVPDDDLEHDTTDIAAIVIPAITNRENLLFTFFILFDFTLIMNKYWLMFTLFSLQN